MLWGFQVAAARVLQSIARAGGASFWAQGGGGYEETVRLCTSHLDDASKAVGDAYATVLGELAACRASALAQQAVRLATGVLETYYFASGILACKCVIACACVMCQTFRRSAVQSFPHVREGFAQQCRYVFGSKKNAELVAGFTFSAACLILNPSTTNA